MKIGIKVVLFLFMLITVSCAKQNLLFLTEEFPPFNFTKDGDVTGLSTEIVQAVLAETDIAYEIQVKPWKESYDLALSTKNSVLFSTSRLENREELFKWVGPIAPANYSVFALKNREFNFQSLKDLKNYKIGITQGDARESYFQSHDFVLGEELVVGESNTANLKKLMNKELDLWPMADAVAYYTVKELGYSHEDVIKNVFKLEDLTKDGYYMAVNLNTSDAVVKKLQTALDKIKSNGTYDSILKKWGL
ncbi:MAG: transporter substrate-binding domain-containing protein [Candidatus Cloacimonetes bacterium]|nr:transporter substrate-binding domain-containing protein [Candidatus Cloacimonadota bacterium]MCF7869194.1 transporter substrate-binding domain-containing protein [Candidatus Cloacimonadota bacterium]